MKKIIVILILILAFIFIGGFFVYRHLLVTHSVAMISGEPISEKEYRLYLYEEKVRFENRGTVEIWKVDFDHMSAEEIAKQNAFETLAVVKISNIEAKKRNIVLDEADADKIELYRNSLYGNVPQDIIEKIGLSDNSIEKIIQENALYLKFFESLTKNISSNHKDFEEYYDAYLMAEQDNLFDYYVSHIYIEDIDSDPLGILNRLQNGEDYYKLMELYSDDYSGEIEIEQKNIGYLFSGLPKIGEISETERSPDGIYIYRIEDIKPLFDEEALRQQVDYEFSEAQKKQFFDKEYNRWKENINIEINMDLYQKIGIGDFE